MGFRVKWALLGLLVFVPGPAARAGGPVPTVRIGVMQGRERVSFSGSEGVIVKALRGGREIARAGPGETWEARADGGRVHLEDASGAREWAGSSGYRLMAPEGGTVTLYGVGEHWDGAVDREYRGVIELRSQRGGLAAVNAVDIETYLRGVVPSEMPARYPVEALKAQAVAARGQALMKAGRHRRDGFDLCAGQHCQVYGGATVEDERSDRAIADTKGEVVVWEGRIADTLYSSNCGGHTANNEDYWVGQRPAPYLRGQPDFEGAGVGVSFPLAEDELEQFLKYAPPVNCNRPGYARASTIRWWFVVPRGELEETLRGTVGEFGELLNVRIMERGGSGIVRDLLVTGSRRPVRLRGGSEIRRAMGGLNSAFFAVEPVKGEGEFPAAFVIWGAGWGHQVGMCQVGAAGQADAGRDYREILAKYYVGCEVVRRY